MTGLGVGVLIVAAVLGPLWWGQRRIERDVRLRAELHRAAAAHVDADDCWCEPNVAAVKHDDGSITWLFLHREAGR